MCRHVTAHYYHYGTCLICYIYVTWHLCVTLHVHSHMHNVARFGRILYVTPGAHLRSCSFFAPFVLEQALFRHVSPPTRGVRLARPKKSSRALSASPFPWFVAAHNLGCELSSFSTWFFFYLFIYLFFILFYFYIYIYIYIYIWSHLLGTWVAGKWPPPLQKLNGSPSWHVHPCSSADWRVN